MTSGLVDRREVSAFCEEHGIGVEVARQRLVVSGLSAIPSFRAAVTFGVEYYKRHRGQAGHARAPKPSDFWDIRHVMCLPYVDVYSTDAFFAGLVKRPAKSQFNTTVVTTAREMVEVLRSGYGLG